MGSKSQPDSPGVRIAVLLHTLDTTVGALDVEHRAGLVRAVAEWVEHHAARVEVVEAGEQC